MKILLYLKYLSTGQRSNVSLALCLFQLAQNGGLQLLGTLELTIIFFSYGSRAHAPSHM